MRYAHYFKIQNDLILEISPMFNVVCNQLNLLKQKFKKQKILNAKIEIINCVDDFINDVQTVVIEFDFYKMPRFIRYANHVKNARQLRK